MDKEWVYINDIDVRTSIKIGEFDHAEKILFKYVKPDHYYRNRQCYAIQDSAFPILRNLYQCKYIALIRAGYEPVIVLFEDWEKSTVTFTHPGHGLQRGYQMNPIGKIPCGLRN